MNETPEPDFDERDIFAACAMVGLLIHGVEGGALYAARTSYELADAMLKARDEARVA